MARVTVDLSDEALTAARNRAAAEGMSLSDRVSALVREVPATGWPESLDHLLNHGVGAIVEPDDPPPADLDTFCNPLQERRP